MGRQGKGGRKKFHPFTRKTISSARPLAGGARLLRMSSKELRQFVSGGGWKVQALLAGAQKHSQVDRGMWALWKRARQLQAQDTLKSPAQKRAEKLAGTYKAPPPDFWGYRLYRRLTKTGKRSVRSVLKHFASHPRFVAEYNSGSGKMGKGVTATYSPRSTCPGTCGFFNDCYANEGNVRSNWIAASLGLNGLPWNGFLKKLYNSPNQKVRVNIAGDLPGDGKTINRSRAWALARAASRNGTRTAWTYTHYPVTRENLATINGMKKLGLQVNLSADNLHDAARKADLGFDVAVVVPADAPGKNTPFRTPPTRRSPQGWPVVKCPAIMHGLAEKRLTALHAKRGTKPPEPTTCSSCGGGRVLCADARRNYIIGFPAHGQRRAKQTDAAAVLRIGGVPAMKPEQRERMLAAGFAVNPRRSRYARRR